MMPIVRGRVVVLLVAGAVRLLAIGLSDRLTSDVLRYHKVGEAVLAGQLNPYELPRLYPYPPVWVWFEAGATWLARHAPVDFPVLVKLPVWAADLAIVGLLWSWPLEPRRGRRAAWIYAVHPVSLLITGFHGQFDSIMLLGVLLAVRSFEVGDRHRSALALAVAIGFKTVPILLLPFFMLRSNGWRGALRYALLAISPVALLLVPFAVDNRDALVRELMGYGGIADLGWIGLIRGIRWWSTGRLIRAEAVRWGPAVTAAKGLFLLAYLGLVAAIARGRKPFSLLAVTLTVFLAFQVLYGAVSAQYLLWVVPLAAMVPDAFFAAHTVAATVALIGFYSFLSPGVLQPQPPLVAVDPVLAGRLWVIGAASVLGVGAAWLAAWVRRLGRSEPRLP